MRWIRRIHLYAGLLMFPWVLLYGFTALLFNHSTLLPGPDTTIHHFQAPAPAGDGTPAATAMAKLVVAELNTEGATEGRQTNPPARGSVPAPQCRGRDMAGHRHARTTGPMSRLLEAKGEEVSVLHGDLEAHGTAREILDAGAVPPSHLSLDLIAVNLPAVLKGVT